MTDRPIIFSAPMVRALIEGRKTQTRRVMKPQPDFDGYVTFGTVLLGQRCIAFSDQNASGYLALPYAPGDRLWVREAFSYADYLADTVWYWADGNVSAFDCSRPKPSIHMPRWASRTTLTVTEVRVQRVQEISEEDAIAEGLYRSEPTEEDEEWNRERCAEQGIPCDPMQGVWMAPGVRQGWGHTKADRNRDQWGTSPQFCYRLIWDSLNAKKPGCSLADNPWVSAVTFSVALQNIDAKEAA